MSDIELSIIIPVKDEEGSIKTQNKKIKDALKGYNYEVIWVDDGSKDDTPKILKDLAAADERVKALVLMRNVGQSGAIMAGIDHANGKYIGLMDGDNQNDPDEFPKMMKLLKEKDLDAVVGWRKDRWKGNIIRRLPSLFANKLMEKSFGNLKIHDTGCPVKLVKIEVLKEVRLYGELHRFLSYIIGMNGAKIGEIPIKHRARAHGVSKYGLKRTFTVIFDIVNVKFLMMRKRTPIQIMGPIAALTYIVGFVSGLYLVIEKIFGKIDITGSPFFIISVICIVMGTQFISFGLLGELIIRSYYENGRDKKTYMVRNEY